MHILSAFWSSVAQDAVDGTVAAVTDQIVQTRNSRYQFLEKRQIRVGFAGIDTGSVLKLDYPSALRISTPIIFPLDADGLGGSLPAIVDYKDKGLILPALEDIGCLASRAGSGAANCAVGLWTFKQFVPAPAGPVMTVRCTASVVATVGTWNIGTLTPDRPLPVGQYAVVGMACVGTNALFARLSFFGQVERPGCMCNVSTSAFQFPLFRMGNLGQFGTFQNYQLPQLEVFGLGTTTTQSVALDIIPLTPLQ